MKNRQDSFTCAKKARRMLLLFTMDICLHSRYTGDVLTLQKHAHGQPARRKRRMSYNRKTLLWLLLCFPVGLSHMWRSRCRWSLGVKYAVSSLAVAALAAVLLLPSPAVGGQGSVTLIGDEPSVEVYGPQAPMNYVRSSGAAQASVIVADEELVDDRLFVYAAANGKNYHMKKCEYVRDTSKKLTVYEAYYAGYTQCSVCNPPAYTGFANQAG